MSEGSRSLSAPFLSFPGSFPTHVMRDWFEAGMYVLHEAIRQLQESSSTDPPDTKFLDMSTSALWVAMSIQFGPSPKSPPKPKKGGAAGYKRDHELLLTGLVSTLEATEQSCRDAVERVCKLLEAASYDEIDQAIDHADKLLGTYLEIVKLPFGREIAHRVTTTPLGGVLRVIEAATSSFASVLDLLKSAKSWSGAVSRLNQVKLLAERTNGTYLDTDSAAI